MDLAGNTMGDDAYISELRQLFPVTRKWNYLYNGGIHPCPLPAAEAMREFIVSWEEGGRDAWPKARDKFNRLRKKFASLCGGKASNIVITDSTSSAINLAAGILNPAPESNVVLSDLTFMNNSYAWLASYPEVEVRFAENRKGIILPGDIVKLIDKNTLAVNLCAVTAGNGFRFDLEEVYSLMTESTPPLLVDASQALGVVPLKVGIPHTDFLACTASKWLMGPAGVAFLYVSDRFLDSVPPSAGWYAASNNREWDVRKCVLHKDATRFQGGMPNLIGAVGALASLELIEQVGIEFIESRVSGLVSYALSGLKKLDLEIHTPENPGQRAGLIFFKHPKAEKLYNTLHSAGIYCGCFKGGIRIDPNFYNTFEEIDQLVSVVKHFTNAENTAGIKA